MDIGFKQMVERFQCPGCVCGSSTSDGCYREGGDDALWGRCSAHVCGIWIAGAGSLALGLPTGFNQVQRQQEEREPRHNTMMIRLWPNTHPDWNNLNVPVWAMEKDGYLFVRTFMPRIGCHAVDVIHGGTIAMAPGAIDVAEFVDEID